MDATPLFFVSLESPAQEIAGILRPIALEPQALPGQDFLAPRPDQARLAVVPSASMVLAQQFDQDILGDLANAWKTFIDSGQVWALIIGIVLGYMIRNLTAY
ncbi:MAG TPA: hypothetical protein IGR64_16615 [Leptolyngbyaceae cyanobacterium M65_K2018_010]|nr:hypothetical protein [Leptolyngbyaceae cyanobacterium M65_K2018_010]